MKLYKLDKDYTQKLVVLTSILATQEAEIRWIMA
jgi:hypothetical protein